NCPPQVASPRRKSMTSLNAVEGSSQASTGKETHVMITVVSTEKVDRRGMARQPLGGEPPVVVLPDYPQKTEAPVPDISPLGLALHLDRPIKPGTLLSVEVYNRIGSYWHFKVVRVVHATPARDSRWLIGSVFLTRFSREEFQGVSASLDAMGQ